MFSSQKWEPHLPNKIPKIFQFLNDKCFALSGVISLPLNMHSFHSVVGGITWFKREKNPRKGEPDHNIYHYIIINCDGKYYKNKKAFKNEFDFNHWSEKDEIINVIEARFPREIQKDLIDKIKSL